MSFIGQLKKCPNKIYKIQNNLISNVEYIDLFRPAEAKKGKLLIEDGVKLINKGKIRGKRL